MDRDEREIRKLVETWLSATKEGDVETVLGLMTDDVVFLIPGQPPMVGKSAFAEMSRAQPNPARFEGKSDIKEVRVAGDQAYLWQHLTVEMTPAEGGETRTHEGHTLSVFRKEEGRWLLARDANLVMPA